MVTIRSVNEIILNLIDFFKLAQPDLDVKAGTVARDLMIEGPAGQLALLYDEVSSVSGQQSLRLVSGSDLDKLAKNYGIVRKTATPSTGVSLFTFSSIVTNININVGDIVLSSNGFSFSVTNAVAVTSASSNFYRSVASKFSDQLSLDGITDQYAVEVTVTANTPGTAGNIGPYSINSTNISGVSNVTNVNAFTGGTDQESDTAFRNRVLSSFSGSSVGTTLGYLNTALGTTGVEDAVVIGPGNPLMTRDGTIVKTNSDGTLAIVSEGSGGKVDVVVLGSTLVQNTDSFIYQDKSNNNDPTNVKNNFVLGQIVADASKTINQKRIDDIANGLLPSQPVDAILQVIGSSSGSNFIAKTVDSLGRVSGNYELIKDTGVYGGSAWGMDTFAWINNQISFSEDLIKGQLNGQDATTFSSVLNIPNIQQNISINNENSIVTSDRSIIQLLHTPAINVTRVLNVNTGERYVVTNQNLDKTPTNNTTGRIQISGNTLPSPSDILQVDYSWIVNYDQYSDYDGLVNTNNARVVNDSIDWGYSSLIRNEEIFFTLNAGNNYFIGNSSHPISTVITAKKFSEIDSVVTQITSGVFTGRLSVVVTNLSVATTAVNSISFKNSNIELYNTAQNNGSFTSGAIVVGINILYMTTIILPTDTLANIGDPVTTILNGGDVFNSVNGDGGSSNGTQITIPSTMVNTTATTINLDVTYIANITDLFSSATTSLPASRSGNGFILSNNNGFNNFSPVNISRRENQTVQQNNNNQLYIELSASSSEYSLLSSQVIIVVRLSDNKELWNSENLGSIAVGLSGNYQLIFTGLNTPAIGDKVLVIYYVTDVRRFQPFSYSNELISSRLDVLSVDPASGNFTIPINNISSQGGGLTFNIFEPNTNIILTSVNDGYLVSGSGSALLGSLSVIFATIPNLLNSKVEILGAINPNNNGIYDIITYNTSNNTMTIKNVLDKIVADQISVIRILDGKEIWNYSGTIDISNNRLLLPAGTLANNNDNIFVIFFKYNNLRQSPTRVIGTISDQVNNAGVITISGTSLNKAKDVVFVATNTGLKLNLSGAIRTALNLNSASSIPNNVRVARITKLEKVTTASASDNSVLEVITTYDLKNTTIQNNLLYADELISNSSLLNLDFILPNTTNNTSTVGSDNLPKIGDKLRVTFYYTIDNDLESLSYTRNGTLYSNKKFSFINKIFVASGFNNSQSTKFTGTSFTQPILGARYNISYNYLGPQINERISITYNHNQLISNVTFSIEDSRPINADVLAREAQLLSLDLTMNVVIASSFISTTDTVLQNLRDALNTALTATQLNSVIDQITLINIAQGIAGIARARILYFNVSGAVGQVLSIQAQEDQYFLPNKIIINTETR